MSTSKSFNANLTCNTNNPSNTNSSNPYCNSWTQFDSNHPKECKCTKVSISNNPKSKYCVSWECHYINQNQIYSKCDCANHDDISYCKSWTCNHTNIYNDNQETIPYLIIEYHCISNVPQNNAIRFIGMTF